MIEVNDVMGSTQKLLEAATASSELAIKFWRPEKTIVRIPAQLDGEWFTNEKGRVVSKTSEIKLGITVKNKDLPLWVITEVRAGLVLDSLRKTPYLEVRPGDRIIEV